MEDSSAGVVTLTRAVASDHEKRVGHGVGLITRAVAAGHGDGVKHGRR